MPLLDIRDLRIRSERSLLMGPLDLALDPGQRCALVGPSGAGKSLTAAAVLGTLPASLRAEGRIRWHGHDVLGVPLAQRQQGRGARLGFVDQDPQRSLNPQTRVGAHLETALGRRPGGRPSEQALELLHELAFAEPAAAHRALPHELSGGQRQRVCLGIALARRPELLIADEPTTALDALTQHQVLSLLDRLLPPQAALLFITHDRAAARAVGAMPLRLADGRLLDDEPIDDEPIDDGTEGAAGLPTAVCAAAGPSLRARAAGGAAQAERTEPGPAGLVVDRLSVRYRTARSRRPAPVLHEVSLRTRPGERVGIVGASGAGKSTLIDTILALTSPSAGSVRWAGRNVHGLAGADLRRFRRRVQLIPQDARGSLAPRATALDQLLQPMALLDERHPGPARRRHAAGDLLGRVGLERRHWHSRPRELSGGQCQRVAIARALATDPELLIADEPLSGLDPRSRRALEDLLLEVLAPSARDRAQTAATAPDPPARPTGLVLVSHDLDSVARLCERVVVLDAGRIVEDCPVTTLLSRPVTPVASPLQQAHRRGGSRAAPPAAAAPLSAAAP